MALSKRIYFIVNEKKKRKKNVVIVGFELIMNQRKIITIRSGPLYQKKKEVGDY